MIRRGVSKSVWIISVIVIIIVILGLGYWYLTPSKPAKKGEKVIKIAAIYALTGKLARHGKTCLDGVQYQVNLINNKGGIEGHKIQLIVYDDESNPSKGAELVEKAITKDNVLVIVGGYGTSIAVPEEEVAERLHTPYFGTGTIDIKSFQRGFKWIFRTIPDSYGYAKPMADFIINIKKNIDPSISKIFIGYTISSHAAIEQTNYTISILKKAGFQIMSKGWKSGTADVHPIMSEVKKFNPDIVILIHYYADTVLFVKTMMEMGVKPKATIGSWGMPEYEFIKELGNASNYFIPELVWSPSAAYPGAKEWGDGFQAKYGYIDYHAAYAAVNIVVISEAIKNLIHQGLPITRKNLRDAIEKLDIMTFYGRIKYSTSPSQHPLGELHQNLYATCIIAQIQNKQQVVIWPPEAAKGKLMYPHKWSS